MARITIEKSIAFDDEKKLYYVTFDYGKDENGKRQKPTKTYNSKSEAKKALKEFEANKTKGMLVMPKKTTLQEWLEIWMDDVIVPTRAETTVYGYQKIIDNHLVPELGAIPLQELKAQQIQRYYAKLAKEKGLSQNTIRKHHDLLNTALKLAVKQDVVVINPVDKVETPKLKEADIGFYTPEQLKALLDAVRGDRLEVIVYLGGMMGLRREEICGLSWKNVDLEKRLIHVVQVRTAAGKDEVIKDPKSRSSKRDISIPDIVLEALIKEKAKQEEYKKLLGKHYFDSDFVAVHENGKPYRPNYLSEVFTRFIERRGFSYVTLHGLRHSFASAANAAGASLFDISKTLGHSNTAITGKIYTHVIDHSHEETMQKVADCVMKTE